MVRQMQTIEMRMNHFPQKACRGVVSGKIHDPAGYKPNMIRYDYKADYRVIDSGSGKNPENGKDDNGLKTKK